MLKQSMTWFPLVTNDSFRNSIIIFSYNSRKIMACKLSMQYNLVYRFLKCALPKDMIDVDLKVCTLKGIHMFKKDYKSQTSKCSPWRAQVKPYPSIKKKMVEFRCQRQAITLYTNMHYHPRPKKTSKKRNLVSLTKPDRSKLSKRRMINVYKCPASTNQLNWKSTTSKSLIQEATDAACSTSTSLAPMQGSQLMNTQSTTLPHSSTASTKVAEEPDYCAICTPLGKTVQEN